ncbi:MAG: hypothetical protein Q9163_005639 [Psora crenata]
MPLTGIFLIPASTATDSSPLQELLTRLSAAYNPTPLAPWTVHHRLFRSTPDGSTSSKPLGTRYLQILSLPHVSARTTVAITSTSTSQAGDSHGAAPEPTTIITVPPGAATSDFNHLLLSKFGPLWQPRMMLTVSHGQAFQIGDFVARLGELKQISGPGASGVQIGRGAVCEIEWTAGGEEGELGMQAGRTVIRGFWEGLGITDKGTREWFWRPEVVGTEREEMARIWLEVLRLRG